MTCLHAWFFTHAKLHECCTRTLHTHSNHNLLVLRMYCVRFVKKWSGSSLLSCLQLWMELVPQHQPGSQRHPLLLWVQQIAQQLKIQLHLLRQTARRQHLRCYALIFLHRPKSVSLPSPRGSKWMLQIPCFPWMQVRCVWFRREIFSLESNQALYLYVLLQ